MAGRLFRSRAKKLTQVIEATQPTRRPLELINPDIPASKSGRDRFTTCSKKILRTPAHRNWPSPKRLKATRAPGLQPG